MPKRARTATVPDPCGDLKKAGLKVTIPRCKILEMLESAAHPHLTAEEVYQRLSQSGEDAGLATVYRVLTQFQEAGIIIRHNIEERHRRVAGVVGFIVDRHARRSRLT
jgi:Fe2+ or Zn2+ uptake regulation protein